MVADAGLAVAGDYRGLMFYPPRPIARARWDEMGLAPDLYARWTSGVFSDTRIVIGQDGKKLLVTVPGDEYLMSGTLEEVEAVRSRLFLNI